VGNIKAFGEESFESFRQASITGRTCFRNRNRRLALFGL
jgi:hypothetical protein